MPTVAVKKESKNNIALVKKMSDYSKKPAFMKKAEKATAFLKKNRLPKSFTSKKK